MQQILQMSFLSAKLPFLWSRNGWKIFLEVHQTNLGPLHTFQGAVRLDANQGKVSHAACIDKVECPRQHATSTAALLDAVDLSHVILNVIHTALDAANNA